MTDADFTTAPRRAYNNPCGSRSKTNEQQRQETANMGTIKIHADGRRRARGTQDFCCTNVVVTHDAGYSYSYLTLPSARYALSCDAPASGVPGCAEFERDFVAAADPQP